MLLHVSWQGSLLVGTSRRCGELARVKWIVVSEAAKSFRNTEALKVVALLKVVSRIVCRCPMRDGVDIQLHFLRALRLPNQHLSWRDQTSNQVQFRVVEVKRFAVEVAV